jgi:hypothetical protein
MDYFANNLGIRPTTYRQILLKIAGIALPRRVGQILVLGPLCKISVIGEDLVKGSNAMIP